MYKLLYCLNIILLISCIITPALSHNCYQCTTVKSDACEDPLYSRGDLNSTYCMPGRELAPVFEVLPNFFSAIINGVFAIVASFSAPSHVDMSCVKLELKGEERNAILRFCASRDMGTQVCHRLRNSAANSTAHCSVCYTDGCNLASSTLQPSSVLALTLALTSCVCTVVV